MSTDVVGALKLICRIMLKSVKAAAAYIRKIQLIEYLWEQTHNPIGCGAVVPQGFHTTFLPDVLFPGIFTRHNTPGEAGTMDLQRLVLLKGACQNVRSIAVPDEADLAVRVGEGCDLFRILIHKPADVFVPAAAWQETREQKLAHRKKVVFCCDYFPYRKLQLCVDPSHVLW